MTPNFAHYQQLTRLDVLLADRLQTDGADRNLDSFIKASADIRACSSPENLLITRHKSGVTRYSRNASCNSPACHGCSSLRQSRNWSKMTRIVDGLLDSQEAMRGVLQRRRKSSEPPKVFWYFTTYTLPYINASQPEQASILNRAFSLLTNPNSFKRDVVAWTKHNEFTVKDEIINAHTHLLSCGTDMDKAKQQKSWTRCVSQAARESGLPVTVDHALRVDVVDLSEKANNDPARLKAELREITSYLTKGSAKYFIELDDRSLQQIIDAPRQIRAFECGGFARNISKVIDKPSKKQSTEPTCLLEALKSTISPNQNQQTGIQAEGNEQTLVYSLNLESTDVDQENSTEIPKNMPIDSYIPVIEPKPENKSGRGTSIRRKMKESLNQDEYLDFSFQNLAYKRELSKSFQAHRYKDALYEDGTGNTWSFGSHSLIDKTEVIN